MNGHIKPVVKGVPNHWEDGWHWTVQLGNECYWWDTWKLAMTFVAFVVNKKGHTKYEMEDILSQTYHHY